MRIAQSLYPDFEETVQAVLESDKLVGAVSQFCAVIDSAYSAKLVEEAGKTFAAQINLIFERERNRAKTDGPDDDGSPDEHETHPGAA